MYKAEFSVGPKDIHVITCNVGPKLYYSFRVYVPVGRTGTTSILCAHFTRNGADKSLAFPMSYLTIWSTTKTIFLGWVKEVRTTKS
jgi:hypothetical protein